VGFAWTNWKYSCEPSLHCQTLPKWYQSVQCSFYSWVSQPSRWTPLSLAPLLCWIPSRSMSNAFDTVCCKRTHSHRQLCQLIVTWWRGRWTKCAQRLSSTLIFKSLSSTCARTFCCPVDSPTLFFRALVSFFIQEDPSQEDTLATAMPARMVSYMPFSTYTF
jgi:hypothetical protein